jgi:hypothetical protein
MTLAPFLSRFLRSLTMSSAERTWRMDLEAAEASLDAAYDWQRDASARNDDRDLGKAYVEARKARNQILRLSVNRPR